MTNPYASHPIYPLRRYLMILAIISFIFGTLACSTEGWGSHIWAFHLLWTFCSALWSIYDLVRYAMYKARDDPDGPGKPDWPSKKVMVGDAVLTVVFGFWYCLELGTLFGYRYSSDALTAYASVTAVGYVVLHAICFWKEFIALKKANWLKELQKSGSCSHSQCQTCQQHHAQHCSIQLDTDVETGDIEDPLRREQGCSEQISIRNPASWLPASLRRQEHIADDVEATDDSPSYLITPFTDEDHTHMLAGSSRDEDDAGTHEQSIEHGEESEAIIKKKAKARK